MTVQEGIELPGPALSRLSQDQSARLYESCLRLLERTGVRLFHQKAVDLLHRAGAKVEDGNRVRIPARLVEWAVSVAPKQITLFDQRGKRAMALHGQRSYFGPGSDCLHIIDHRTGTRRTPILRDVIEGVSLCDSLENIDFVMSMFLPSDVNQRAADRSQMEVMLSHTSKPIVFVSFDASGCVDAVRMAEIVRGGSSALQEKPSIVCYINVTTGLRHNEEALQKLIFLADKAIPACYIPGAMAGAAAPVTVAGSTVVRMAGALAGALIAQLTREGAPVLVPGWGALALNMRTTVMSYAGPDHQGVTQALGHYLGLPLFSNGGSSDSKLVDQQAGIEAALTLMINAVAGSHVVHDVGYLESGLSCSLAQMVMCDEIIAWIKRCLAPVDLSDESLGLELIDRVGPDGQFLDNDHTLRHFREQWHPPLFDRDGYDRWSAKDGKSLAEKAAQKVDVLLGKHLAPDLPADIVAELQQIVRQAEETAK